MYAGTRSMTSTSERVGMYMINGCVNSSDDVRARQNIMNVCVKQPEKRDTRNRAAFRHCPQAVEWGDRFGIGRIHRVT